VSPTDFGISGFKKIEKGFTRVKGDFIRNKLVNWKEMIEKENEGKDTNTFILINDVFRKLEKEGMQE
jgi:hypothetical protein